MNKDSIEVMRLPTALLSASVQPLCALHFKLTTHNASDVHGGNGTTLAPGAALIIGTVHHLREVRAHHRNNSSTTGTGPAC